MAPISRRYVKNGASGDFVGAFGSTDVPCPAPDFDKIIRQRHAAKTAAQRATAQKLALVLVPLAVSGVLLTVVRRRRRG